MCAKTSPSTAVLPSVPVRPQKDGAVPSWLRTDGTVDNTIVMLEKLNYVLSERATRPIYMKVQVRLNAISPYQSQQSSPAIRDITVSGHSRLISG